MTTIPIPEQQSFEQFVIARYPKFFAEWELDASEYMELGEWAEKAHPDIVDAWRKAKRGTHV